MDQPIYLKILRIMLVVTHSYSKCYNVYQIIHKGFLDFIYGRIRKTDICF